MDPESVTVVEPFPSTDTMYTLADFLKQAEEAQEALRVFACVKDLKNCDKHQENSRNS
jgi:hypothetical protein